MKKTSIWLDEESRKALAVLRKNKIFSFSDFVRKALIRAARRERK